MKSVSKERRSFLKRAGARGIIRNDADGGRAAWAQAESMLNSRMHGAAEQLGRAPQVWHQIRRLRDEPRPHLWDGRGLQTGVAVS